MSGSNQAFSGEGGLIGEDEAGRIGGEGHAGEEGRASASTPSLLSLTHPSSGSLQAYDIASGGGGVNMSVDRDEPYKGVPRSSFIPIAGPSTGTPTPMFTSGRDSSPSRYSPHVSAGSGGQYAHIGSSAAGMTGRQLQGEGGGHGGRDSPSKAAFDSFTSARRPLSRSSSPSLLPTRVVPPRSPSPLHSFRHNPDLSASTSSDVQLAHGPAPTLHRRPHKTEGLLDLSPATSLPYLSLPRSRSPEPLSLPGASSSSSRSMSPVSPGSMDFPQTAPIGSGSFGAHRDGGLKGLKKRPLPLDLTRGQGVGVDPELQVHMDEVASARSAKSSDSLSHEMNDLSLLRNKIRQNLHERPIGSTSDQSDSTASEPPLSSAIQHDIDPAHLISADELHDLHNSAEPHIILDCRSPIAYGQDHLDGSLNVSIPTLIVKRLRKGVGSRPTWGTVGSYIAGQDGKSKWENLDRNARVVLLGETGRDEVARILRDVVGEMIPNGSAQILSGGWGNFHLPGSGRRVVSSSSIQTGQGGMLPPPRASRFGPVPDTAPIPAQPSVFVAPPTPPNVIAPRLANQLSMPSLRARRAQDQLNSGKKLPQLSLNVAPPLPAKAATLDSIGADKRAPKSPGMLTINTGVPNAAAPGPSPTSQGFPMTARKSSFGSHPLRSPMTKSFGRSLGAGSSTGPGTASGSKTPAPLTSLPQRTGHMAGGQHMIDPSDIPAGGAPGSARPAIAPFLVSTIIPNFLYLGPEILEQHEVDELQKLGVKRILNVAIECDDDSGLKLSEVFDRYHHIPMRDIVEEVHLSAGINNAMAFLDDARLRDSPTYVHCKAGKSRSVTIVLAYLIHSNAWTLRTAYSFVAERRPGISPNIGFVAELMQYAEVELGLRQHRAAQGDDQSTTSGARGTGKVKRTRARDSMPAAAPAWSSSLQEPQPARLSPAPEVTGTSGGHGAGMQIKGGEEARKVDEREIRREGAWVQHRRAPKDDRLRPSRRVSKAGLETIASVAVVRSPSPHPTSTFTSKPATPSTEGRAGWL